MLWCLIRCHGTWSRKHTYTHVQHFCHHNDVGSSHTRHMFSLVDLVTYRAEPGLLTAELYVYIIGSDKHSRNRGLARST